MSYVLMILFLAADQSGSSPSDLRAIRPDQIQITGIPFGNEAGCLAAKDQVESTIIVLAGVPLNIKFDDAIAPLTRHSRIWCQPSTVQSAPK
jgi:hypothetical protein